MKLHLASGPRIILLFVLACFLAPAHGQTTQSLKGDAAINLFFIGKRRSTLEPCGCHTKQQGGIQFEGAHYEQHAENPQLRLDAGEWANPIVRSSPVESMKTRYLLRGMNLLGIDVANVAIGDVQVSDAFFESIRQTHPDALDRLVSANVFKKSNPEEHAFAKYRILERKLADGSTVKFGITGATTINDTFMQPGKPVVKDPAAKVETDSFIVKQPQEALKPVLDELRPQVDVLILLYAGDFASTFDFVQAFPQVDWIVSTARSMEPNTIYYRERQSLVFIAPNFQGKELGLARLQRVAGGKWQVAGQPEVLIVSKDLPTAAPINDLIAEFKKETESLAVKPDPNAARIYAGAESCVTCHSEVYHQWKGTPHAHAMQTLNDIAQQFNPECTKCHVTGFMSGNGFYSVTDPQSLQMVNVQCEVCHGPALQHVYDQQKLKSGAEKWMKPEEFKAFTEQAKTNNPKKEVPVTVCTQCHTDVTNPDFNYEKMIVQVNHSKPYERDPNKPAKKKMTMIPQGAVDKIKAAH